jgi:hypothetical protein
MGNDIYKNFIKFYYYDVNLSEITNYGLIYIYDNYSNFFI